MAVEIGDDAFLASLYARDDDVELKAYSPEFSTTAEAQHYADIIRKLPFKQLSDRLLRHSKLSRNFRHFQLIRFEAYDEPDIPELKQVPYLLSRRANLSRYAQG